jgi:hypothetical protein
MGFEFSRQAILQKSSPSTIASAGSSDSKICHLASNSIRASFTCCQFSVIQSTRPCIGRSRLRLRGVNSYSTRSGTSGNNSRVSNPSLSKFLNVNVSILCEMPGIALSSSENRARSPGSFAKERSKKIVHLSPTFVRSSRTAEGSAWPQTNAEFRGLLGLLFFILTPM